jgi:hypothetical protein
MSEFEEIEPISYEDLLRVGQEWAKKMSAKLTSDDQYFTFSAEVVGGEGYEIPFYELKNSEDVLSWIAHLSDKVWFDMELLRYFLLQVDEVLGINPHNGQTRPTRIRKKIGEGDFVRVVNPKKINDTNRGKVFSATATVKPGCFFLWHPGDEIQVMRDTDLELVQNPNDSDGQPCP